MRYRTMRYTPEFSEVLTFEFEFEDAMAWLPAECAEVQRCEIAAGSEYYTIDTLMGSDIIDIQFYISNN